MYVYININLPNPNLLRNFLKTFFDDTTQIPLDGYLFGVVLYTNKSNQHKVLSV